MAIKDLALLKVVGSIIKKGKDKILTVKDKGTVSSDESVMDTFKKAFGKDKLTKYEDEKVAVDTKTEEEPKVEKTTQEKTVKKVEKEDIPAKKSVKKDTPVKTKPPKKTEKKVEKEKPSSKTPTQKKRETPKVKATEKKESVKKESKKTSTKAKQEPKKDETVEKKEKVKASTSTKKVAKKETKTTTVKKTVAKKEPATKAKITKAPVAKAKTTTTQKETAPSKKEEKIAKYTKDIEKHLGSVDTAFLEIVVKNLGPSIYRRDAEGVSCSDEKELDTVRRNFLIKKLGYDKKDNDMLDAEIKKVCEAMKGTKVKYRATFYYMLAKNLKKESALS